MIVRHVFQAGFYAGIAVPRVDDQEVQAQGDQAWTRYVMSMSSTQKMAMMRPDLYPGPQATDICEFKNSIASIDLVCDRPRHHDGDHNLIEFTGRGVAAVEYTEGPPRQDAASLLISIGDWAKFPEGKIVEVTELSDGLVNRVWTRSKVVEVRPPVLDEASQDIRSIAREAFGKAYRGADLPNTHEQLDAAIVAVLRAVLGSLLAGNDPQAPA